MSRAVRFAPLRSADLLIVGAGLAACNAGRHDRLVASWKASRCPTFALPAAVAGEAGARHRRISRRASRASLNIFASWCVPCIGEVQVLQRAEEHAASTIDGIAVRDTPEDVAAFLAATATRMSGSAATRRAACRSRSARRACPRASSSMGRGVIRYQHIGPIEASDVPMILAKLEQAR